VNAGLLVDPSSPDDAPGRSPNSQAVDPRLPMTRAATTTEDAL